MCRRGVILLFFVVLVFVMSADVVAQIKIIPQTKLDSVSNPRTVANAPMTFIDGNRFTIGDIREDAAAWSRSIKWHNEGGDAIVITSVKSSCSCLKAEVVNRVVMEGADGEIKLSYLPKGHMGAFEQRVYVYTNLSQTIPTAVLYVRGRVVSSVARANEYPYHRGMLRLRQDTLRLEGRRSQTLRVACLNAGSRSMRLSEDTLLTSEGITMRCEPEVLPGGAEGDLVITYNASESANEQSLRLYIKGLTLPPRERLILLKVIK